jgi:hypothetical protein
MVVGQGVLHRDRAVAGQGGTVLRARDEPVAVLAGQVDQHREPGGALDQGADGRALQPDDQVTVRVARNGAIGGLSGPLADQDLFGDVRPRLLPGSCPRDAQRSTSAQAGHQLALQRELALDEQGLVDRLVADPHGLILGELHPQPVGDLLRAPPAHPAPVTAMRLVPALPGRAIRAEDRPTAVPHDAGEPVLDLPAQPVVDHQLGDLRPPGTPLGMPLRDRGLVVQPVGARGGVAAQFTSDRRRAPTQSSGDRSNARALRAP